MKKDVCSTSGCSLRSFTRLSECGDICSFYLSEALPGEQVLYLHSWIAVVEAINRWQVHCSVSHCNVVGSLWDPLSRRRRFLPQPRPVVQCCTSCNNEHNVFRLVLHPHVQAGKMPFPQSKSPFNDVASLYLSFPIPVQMRKYTLLHKQLDSMPHLNNVL